MSSDKIIWQADAEQRMKKVPFFVRKLAIRKLENAAKAQGLTTITVELIDSIKQQEMG